MFPCKGDCFPVKGIASPRKGAFPRKGDYFPKKGTTSPRKGNFPRKGDYFPVIFGVVLFLFYFPKVSRASTAKASASLNSYTVPYTAGYIFR